LPSSPKDARNINIRNLYTYNKNPDINLNKNRYEVLSQGENVPSSEMLVDLVVNAGISFEMPILEGNPEMDPPLGKVSHTLDHEEEIDYSPSKSLYSSRVGIGPHVQQPIDYVGVEEGKEKKIEEVKLTRKYKRNLDKDVREEIAYKEVNLGSQITLDRMYDKGTRNSRNQSGSNSHVGGSHKNNM
jgi:hypothetical protein